jgi:hypothetical protein
LNDAKQLKQTQEKQTNGPPKSLFLVFLDAAIALAQKVTNAPSLEAVTKDLGNQSYCPEPNKAAATAYQGH